MAEAVEAGMVVVEAGMVVAQVGIRAEAKAWEGREPARGSAGSNSAPMSALDSAARPGRLVTAGWGAVARERSAAQARRSTRRRQATGSVRAT